MDENKKNTLIKFKINENIIGSETHLEKLHPNVESDLKDRKHSLGKHPIFPMDEEQSFEHKLVLNYFKDAIKRYKKVFEVGNVDVDDVMRNIMPLVTSTMLIESAHNKELEKLAVEAIREEFGIDKDVVDINAELVPEITLMTKKMNDKPVHVDMEFKNHAEMEEVKDEVYKRRFINAMVQGAATKSSEILRSVENELMDINTLLPTKYLKIMTAGDIINYMIPKAKSKVNGGSVLVEFPSKKNPKAVIHAQAMIFPVLIYELVMGVMELISEHALPKNGKIKEYIKSKADFTAATPWDMKLGPALWSRFTDVIGPENIKLKQHIYYDLISMPVKEFNYNMREILAGTKEGKKLINDLATQIKADLEYDNLKDSDKKELEDNDTFSIEDLINDKDSDNEETFSSDEI